jgi:hypothetical protein
LQFRARLTPIDQKHQKPGFSKEAGLLAALIHKRPPEATSAATFVYDARQVTDREFNRQSDWSKTGNGLQLMHRHT